MADDEEYNITSDDTQEFSEIKKMDIEKYQLTPDEADTFAEVRHQLRTSFKVADDYKIVRFLRAKMFDMKSAWRSLDEDIDWRQAEKIDSITQSYEAPEVLRLFLPVYILGQDREGSPVLVIELGNADMNGLMKCVSFDIITRHVTYILEIGEKYMSDNVQYMERQKWFVLIDCNELSPLYASNRTFRNYVKTIAEFYGEHYPERLKTAWAINASQVFHQFLTFLRPCLSQTTVSKVNVYETSGWQDKLVQVIDPGILPTYFNGRVRDIVKHSSVTPIIRGGQVPKKYFYQATNEVAGLKAHLGVTEYVLGRGEIFRVPVQITIPKCVIRWEFETLYHSIGFGLDYQQNEKSPIKTLIPIQKIYCDNFAETGEYMCEETGIYTLIFDNSFSWVVSKQLYFKYTVRNP